MEKVFLDPPVPSGLRVNQVQEELGDCQDQRDLQALRVIGEESAFREEQGQEGLKETGETRVPPAHLVHQGSQGLPGQ